MDLEVRTRTRAARRERATSHAPDGLVTAAQRKPPALAEAMPIIHP